MLAHSVTPRISYPQCAAAMASGTGLEPFSRAYPRGFYDAGIAEEPAVTFAAGLAAAGLRPVCAIYSTFLQRSYDQIIHDVNLLRENVVFAVDRAGFVPGDGETHQGIYDPAFLSQTGMPIYSPSNYEELRHWLPILLSHEMQGPRAIRYPRGGESKALAKYGRSGKKYDKLIFTPGAKAALVSYADEVEDVLTAAELLTREGISCDVYKLVRIFPFEEELIRDLSAYPVVLMAEECVACGGIGGLYKNSTNFPHITGDAIAMALRHGVACEHLAKVQINPTTLYRPQ